MPKPVRNSRIDYANSGGRVNQHDIWLDQPVTKDSSPTFANVVISGNAQIIGNLYVEGNTSIYDSSIMEFIDNIILLNINESGSGVTLNQAGLEIERGSLTNYRIVYDEPTQTFRVGVIGTTAPGNINTLEPVALREETPLDNGIMIYSAANKRIEARDHIDINTTFTSTVNSTSTTTGALQVRGGVGIIKDTSIGGNIYLKSSSIIDDNVSLTLTNKDQINLSSSNVLIPSNSLLSFSNTTNNIVSNGDNLNINSLGYINLTTSISKSINVPKQVPIVFSTDNEKIYADNLNNMNIKSSKNIYLTPSAGSTVFIPQQIPLTFGSLNQQIVANINNDLVINANNNINLNPGVYLNVRIPTNNGLKFGGTGNQIISANVSNELLVRSTQDINLLPSTGYNVNISSGTLLTFGEDTQYVTGDTNGNLVLGARNNIKFKGQFYIADTTNSTSATNGSIHTDGGLGVKKDIVCESSIIINSTNVNALSVNGQFNVDGANYGMVNAIIGDGTYTGPSFRIKPAVSSLYAKSLISLTSNFDTNPSYMIGRGSVALHSGRALSINIPSYSDYDNTGDRPKFSITTDDTNTELFSIESGTGNIYTYGAFGISGTENAVSPTTGSLILFGGLGVVKDIYTSGKYTSEIDSDNALKVIDTDKNPVFNVNTNNMKVDIYGTLNVAQNETSSSLLEINPNTSQLVSSLDMYVTSTKVSTDCSNGSITVEGGVGIKGSLNVGQNASFLNGIDMLNSYITNLADPINDQDAATKAYVDLVKQGLYVKDSVRVATRENLNLFGDFAAGNIIDNYLLQIGDRILIKTQVDQTENGIYIITSGTPSRADDLSNGTSAAGTYCFVQTGDSYAGLGFICNVIPGIDIVGTDPLNYTEFTGVTKAVAGIGLGSLGGNELFVVVDNTSIEIVANALRIKNTAVSTGLTGGSGSPLQTTSDQSHVTKLGTIDQGLWRASTLEVSYGGTGQTFFTSGNILFGNDIYGINTESTFHYDNLNKRVGLGTNIPLEDLHIANENTTTLLVDSDINSTNQNARPEIKLRYSGSNGSSLGMSRNYDNYGNNTYPDALILANDQTSESSIIQFVTNQQSQLTILANGYIGINTTIPTYNLDVNGSFNVSGLVNFENLQASINSSTGSVVLNGGLSVDSTIAATNVSSGGAFTVSGGVAISKNLFIGESINASYNNNTSTFNKLYLVSTESASNETSGALLINGGITIVNTNDANSLTQGGSLLTMGGGSINKSLYVGDTLYGLKDAFLGNFHLSSTVNANFLQSPNVSRTVDSFIPINFSLYDNMMSSILTIHSSGMVISNDGTLQIGGTLNIPNGYTISYTNGNLNVLPYNTDNNLNIGTIGHLSNVNLYNETGVGLEWNSSSSNLRITDTTFELTSTSSQSIIISTPNNTDTSYVSANGSDMILNFGGNSVGGELTTILSNSAGDSTITFTPENSTSSLVLTENVKTTLNGPVTFQNTVNYSGNALHTSITNESESSKWVYFGQIGSESGYCEIDFNNGSNRNNSDITGLKIVVSINGGICTASHFHYGNMAFNSEYKPICYIYKDNVEPTSSFKLFGLLPSYSQTNINVIAQRNDPFEIIDAGNDLKPIGMVNSWSEVYVTNIESNLKFTFGDTKLEGSLKVADNLPVIGYNNSNTTNSRDLGILYQRYQVQNDIGTGDIVSDPVKYIDSIPNQTSCTIYQLRLSNLASSSDDYYNGWWVKMFSGSNTNQVRQIITYNGGLRLATLSTPFTIQNPGTGDTAYLYNNTYVTNYYDEIEDTFSLGYTHTNVGSGNIINNTYADLKLRKLYSTDTLASTNSSTGSVRIAGSIALFSSVNATSSTNGGTITTNGGVGINKNLLVGQNIGIGGSGFVPQESLHIRKTEGKATVRLENNTGDYSYIDYVENGTNNRFGTLLDSNLNQFSLTYTTVGVTPNQADRALTINNNGFIGINTINNINSPLALNNSNFISTNSTSGFLGFIGGSSNLDGNAIASRIILNSNGIDGSLSLYSGNTTSGNINMYTGDDVKAVSIDNLGIVSIESTQISEYSTTGALVVFGGIGIACTENSSSYTNGGALTIDGGASIQKDLYIGGDLYIRGSLNAIGSSTTPVISFNSAINCTLNEYYNSKLINVGDSNIFTMGFSLLPIVASEDTEIRFTLPNVITDFTRRSDVNVTVSGYIDNTNLVVLYNIIGVGVVGTKDVLVKFQSISTNFHYLQLQAIF
jgi:hypothetical protein